jgi:hypothetical protein
VTLPTYTNGTASIANGGTVVAGAGTVWSGVNVREGDFFVRADGMALITEVTDVTHLKITPWPGATVAGGAYTIQQNFVGRVVGVAAAEDVATLISLLGTAAYLAGDQSFTGKQTFANATEATGVGTTAAALFSGGVEIAKKLFVAGAVSLASTLAVAGALNVGGVATFNSGGNILKFSSPGAGFWYDSYTTANRFFIGTDVGTDTLRIYAAGIGNVLSVNGASGNVALTGLLSLGAGQIEFPATQLPSSNPNTLDDYEEGTGTPFITFGGASVGITYATQTLDYVKVGKLVFVTIVLTLSNKGSSIGSAQIGGLPFVGSSNAPIALNMNNGAASATTQMTGAGGSAGATTINPQKFAAGAVTVLSDADFNNNTLLRIALTYLAS